MAHFGFQVIDPNSNATLDSSSGKVTAANSETFQLTHTVTLTPASDEYVVVSEVALDINANTIVAVQIYGGVSFQPAGESESSVAQTALWNKGSGNSGCSNDTGYGTRTDSAGAESEVGLGLTVRGYIRSGNASNSTSLCARNFVVTGRLVKVINEVMAAQFRGSF